MYRYFARLFIDVGATSAATDSLTKVRHGRYTAVSAKHCPAHEDRAMSIRDRMGFDAGGMRLEEALEWAAHGEH